MLEVGRAGDAALLRWGGCWWNRNGTSVRTPTMSNHERSSSMPVMADSRSDTKKHHHRPDKGIVTASSSSMASADSSIGSVEQALLASLNPRVEVYRKKR